MTHSTGPVTYNCDGLRLTIPTNGSAASVFADDAAVPVWEGTLLPALVLVADGAAALHYPSVAEVAQGDRSVALTLEYGSHARGSCVLRVDTDGVVLDDLVFEFAEGVALADVYFGLSPLTAGQRQAVADFTVPEWPDWSAAAMCSPGMDPATSRSIARRWEMGQADVALGSFGPASGTPYGAAFPRPVYSAMMGDDRGWVLVGAVDIPAGEASLMMRGTSAAMRWQVRDDLWGTRNRVEFGRALRLLLAPDPVTAWHRYAATFPPAQRPALPSAFATTFNTWGDYRHGDYSTPRQVTMAKRYGAETLVLDQGWETQDGSALPDSDRIGSLSDLASELDLADVRIGFWQAVAWIDTPEAFGLGVEDLIVGADGVPIKTNWALDPRQGARFLIDPSSERARRFLVERTKALVAIYEAATIKLDFAYAFPSVARAVPRDPALRGERLAYAISTLLADAAREAGADVSVLGYSAHPAYAAIFDVISLDDMGDGGFENEGLSHRHWSVWASALGSLGIPVSGSSGYNVAQDGEIVLNTAVLGSPGAIFAGSELEDSEANRTHARRLGIGRWHRRTAQWWPLWLDSELGSPDRQPRVASWGRLEGEERRLTALALRSSSPHSLADARPPGFESSADVAIIALGDGDLKRGTAVAAVIPVTSGEVRLPLVATAARVEMYRPGRPPEVTLIDVTDDAVSLVITESDLDEGVEGWVVERVDN